MIKLSFTYPKADMAKKQQLITVKAAAQVAGFTEEYIRRLLREGWIEGQKIVSVWMVDKHSLDDYLKSKRARKPQVDSSPS